MTAQVQELRLELPHIELSARVFGPEDGYPVLALHGWLDNAMTFAQLAPRLHGLRIVALDLPGHGLSAHRPAGVGYAIQDYVLDVLAAARQLGWTRFGLLGHSMGAIVGVIAAAALPEQIERLALIDGLLPYTTPAEEIAEKLGKALLAELELPNRRKPVYATVEDAVAARLKGALTVSREAAELLAERGLMAVPGGYTWRSDPHLRLPSRMRFTPEQAEACLRAVRCPTALVVAAGGLVAPHAEAMRLAREQPNFSLHELPGGHHLHLDDAAGAQAVADCFNAFFAAGTGHDE
ncbi:alpha/beta fold hydrolase [Pseudomonas sp. JUb52]|uniref:alpha/beta fold hydrolase n=1 Tax=Pseudomonas sp. JUb52 TaxID=2485127 RepID=UPI00104B976E|nr:alpha/beta hydrolase [Pseudomonas sp. JUb52]TCQ94266.1 epoxide hydrolase [Pseudomonas sp. JUb52]